LISLIRLLIFSLKPAISPWIVINGIVAPFRQYAARSTATTEIGAGLKGMSAIRASISNRP
jgi:hypothetical protein